MGDTINLFETGNQNGNTGYTVLTLPTGMLHPSTVDTDDERLLGTVAATIAEGSLKRRFIERSSDVNHGNVGPFMGRRDLDNNGKLWELQSDRLDNAAKQLGAQLLDQRPQGKYNEGLTTTRLLPASTNGIPEDLTAYDLDHVLTDEEISNITAKLFSHFLGPDNFYNESWFNHDDPYDNLHLGDLLKTLAGFPYVCEGGRGSDDGYHPREPSSMPNSVPFNMVSTRAIRNSKEHEGDEVDELWHITDPVTEQPLEPNESLASMLPALSRTGLVQTIIVNDSFDRDAGGFVTPNDPSPIMEITKYGGKYVGGVELYTGDYSTSYRITRNNETVNTSSNNKPIPSRVNPAGLRILVNKDSLSSDTISMASMDDPIALYVLVSRHVHRSSQQTGTEVSMSVTYQQSLTSSASVRIVLRDDNGNIITPNGGFQPTYNGHGGAYDTGAQACEYGSVRNVCFTTGNTDGLHTFTDGQSFLTWLLGYSGASINTIQLEFTPPDGNGSDETDYRWVKIDWDPQYKNWNTAMMEQIRGVIAGSITDFTPGDYEAVTMSCHCIRIAAVYGPIRPTS